MGIIIRQSLKGSIWSYLGLIIGYINVGIIMPQFFRTDQIGLVQLFAALTIIFANFSTLGFVSVINKMFPIFRNKKENHNGFLFIALFTGLTGFLLSLIVFFVLKPQIVESNIDKSPLLNEYIIFLVPLIFFKIIYQLLNNYNIVLYDAVTGTFWSEFIHRAINLFLTILFALEILVFRQFFFGYIISISLPVIPLIFVLIKRGEFNLRPNFGFLKRPLIIEMITVSAFGLLMGLSGVLTNNIDKLLISRFLTLDLVGIFSICALFATVINIPSLATTKISTGIIAQSWENNNKKHIQEIFQKASLNQTIIGTFIFLGILINLDNIFAILPNDYQQGKWVLIFYSIGTLIRVSATTSGAIIATSKYYKTLAFFIGSQIIYTIVFHFIFIPIYGITGAAISVMLTYLVRTLFLVGFIQIKLNMFCYQIKHVWVLIIAAIAFGTVYLTPSLNNLILNILFKSVIAIVVYVALIIYFNVSSEINIIFLNLRNSVIAYIRNKL